MKRIEIFDSTLRDGAQGEGISFSVNDKLQIVKALDDFGVDFIEAGNPGSNPKDLEFFHRASELKLNNAKLCAFGSTRRKNITPERDSNLQSLLEANTEVVVIFGKSWDLHVTEILKATLEENIDIVESTVAYLVSKDKRVIFDAEHFFDGYKANSDYAIQVLEAADRGGAEALVLCDTNGGTMPNEVYNITKTIAAKLPKRKIGIHCHDDTGCAVANSMVAIEAGASQVQGTFIGIGERCGNADLSIIIPNIRLKMKLDCGGDIEALFLFSRRIAEVANKIIEPDKPYTGLGAFAHKGGMHIDGVLKLTSSFEHITPETVGNTRRFLMSEVSGRSMIIQKIQHFVPELTKESPKTSEILERLKDLEHQGYHFEGADASFELLVKKVLGTYRPHFRIVLYKTMGEFPVPEGGMPASATIKVEVNGEEEVTAMMGNGPVNALDLALRKALAVFYPDVREMQLTDYKVRVLESNSTTAARVRVLIETSDGCDAWTTIGVSNDIIEASLIALADSVEYKLSKVK